MGDKPKVRTVFIGQFTHAHAEAMAEELEEAGIVWWFKQSGGIGQFFFRGDWGVRLFADQTRVDDVRAIAARVAQRLGIAK